MALSLWQHFYQHFLPTNHKRKAKAYVCEGSWEPQDMKKENRCSSRNRSRSRSNNRCSCYYRVQQNPWQKCNAFRPLNSFAYFWTAVKTMCSAISPFPLCKLYTVQICRNLYTCIRTHTHTHLYTYTNTQPSISFNPTRTVAYCTTTHFFRFSRCLQNSYQRHFPSGQELPSCGMGVALSTHPEIV